MEELLIAEVRKRPCLYNKKIQSYKSQTTRRRAWSEISKVVGLDSKRCQQRWKSLRDTFVRQSALYANSKKDREEFPHWTYLENLSFLCDHVEPRCTKFKVEASEFVDVTCDSDQSESITYELLNESEKPSCSKPKSKKENKEDTIVAESVNQFQNLVDMANAFFELKKEEYTRDKTKGRNESFYKVLESYLCKVTDAEQDSIKMEILNLVFQRTMPDDE